MNSSSLCTSRCDCAPTFEPRTKIGRMGVVASVLRRRYQQAPRGTTATNACIPAMTIVTATQAGDDPTFMPLLYSLGKLSLSTT
jgi:hypothetical protein